VSEPITARQFHEADGVEDWRVVAGAGAYFHTASFAASARFVQAISELSGLDDHQPDLDVRPGGVHVSLNTVTDDYYGLTTRDLELARQISAVARELGVPADPRAVQSLVLPIDALVIPGVLPFWHAVLGYELRADTPDMELNDPHNRWPIVCFGQMDAPRPQRNRIHIDVWVPRDQAEARVAAAISAGGHLVTDRYAPGWWVLADAEGNEACVATWYSNG
jgi:4a-hydroxytetrahydrobiopterin dehydratase